MLLRHLNGRNSLASWQYAIAKGKDVIELHILLPIAFPKARLGIKSS
jgi:hypothetical protein